jgi:hypothetical protein
MDEIFVDGCDLEVLTSKNMRQPFARLTKNNEDDVKDHIRVLYSFRVARQQLNIISCDATDSCCDGAGRFSIVCLNWRNLSP